MLWRASPGIITVVPIPLCLALHNPVCNQMVLAPAPASLSDAQMLPLPLSRNSRACRDVINSGLPLVRLQANRHCLCHLQMSFDCSRCLPIWTDYWEVRQGCAYVSWPFFHGMVLSLTFARDMGEKARWFWGSGLLWVFGCCFSWTSAPLGSASALLQAAVSGARTVIAQ